MPKEDAIEIRGTVADVLPNGMFKVEIETGQTIIAHLAGKLRIRSIKVVKGDGVLVEMSPYDLTRGRIVYRLKHLAA